MFLPSTVWAEFTAIEASRQKCGHRRSARRCGGYYQRDQVAHRVDHLVVDAHLEVEVGTGGQAGRTLTADALAAGDPVAEVDVRRQEVRVQGDYPAAVGDHHVVSVADRGVRHPDHDAVGRGHHRGAQRRPEVDAGVEVRV